MWSFGATLAEFFTPLRLLHSEELDDDDEISDVEDPHPPQPFIVPRNLGLDPDARWVRDTLFNASRGEIGLAWSIFRVRGTPTPDIWPVCFLSHDPLASAHRKCRHSTIYQIRRVYNSQLSPLCRLHLCCLIYRTTLVWGIRASRFATIFLVTRWKGRFWI
jgi:hypothetical protein